MYVYLKIGNVGYSENLITFLENKDKVRISNQEGYFISSIFEFDSKENYLTTAICQSTADGFSLLVIKPKPFPLLELS